MLSDPFDPPSRPSVQQHKGVCAAAKPGAAIKSGRSVEVRDLERQNLQDLSAFFSQFGGNLVFLSNLAFGRLNTGGRDLGKTKN